MLYGVNDLDNSSKSLLVAINNVVQNHRTNRISEDSQYVFRRTMSTRVTVSEPEAMEISTLG